MSVTSALSCFSGRSENTALTGKLSRMHPCGVFVDDNVGTTSVRLSRLRRAHVRCQQMNSTSFVFIQCVPKHEPLRWSHHHPSLAFAYGHVDGKALVVDFSRSTRLFVTKSNTARALNDADG